MPLVYDELRGMAARYLSRETPGNTLQSTALVHEAFLKLVDQREVEWQNRAHFFGLAAQMMRRILVDHARHAHRSKRGGGVAPLPIESALLVSAAPATAPVDVLALDAALSALEALDPQQARIVELRFFGGLTVDETAEAVGVSTSSIKREWAVAKAWLFRHISEGTPANDDRERAH
jgi:RNA polymerase sigma-70 factor (ECF subfamily)